MSREPATEPAAVPGDRTVTAAPEQTLTLPTPGADPTATTAAGDRYALGERIAEGGMGEVVRATDRVLGRPVAVKLVKAALRDHAGLLRRFEEEARITARLQHPGVPPVYDLGVLPDGRPFLAMKLIEGHTLAAILAGRATPAADLAAHLQTFEAICLAVAYAHEQGVVHRDLKPLNVMVGAFGEVQVMDWGLAKVVRGVERGVGSEEGEHPAPEQTRAGSVMGTAAHMPPEQARGEIERIDRRADVFALGSILCQILTGEPVYAAPGVQALLQAERADQADAERRLAACGADAELIALARRCLAPEPDDRPADAGAVAGAVAAYRQGVERRLREAERERAAAEARAAEERKRRRVQALAWAAGALLVAVAAGAWWWIDRERARQEGATREAAGGNLDAAHAALQRHHLVEAAAALDQVRHRLGDSGPDDLRRREAALSRDLAMARTLDRLASERWTFADGQSQYVRVRQAYPEAFAGYGLAVARDDAATVLAALDRSPIRDRLLRGLEDWLTMSEAPAERRALAAVLNAADADALCRRAREAFAADDLPQLRRIAAEVRPEQLTARLVLLLADRPIPAADRLRLLRLGRDAFPDDPGLAFQLAWWLRPTGAPKTPAALQEAEGALRSVLFARPQDGVAWNSLGTVLQARGLAEAAFHAYQKAARYDPDNALPHFNLGNHALREGKDADTAVAHYEAALRLDPRYAPAHSGLAAARHAKGDLEGALAASREAVRVDPRYTLGFYNLGQLEREKGNLEAAARAFGEATRLDPRHARAWCERGNVLVWLGRFDEAAAALARGHELGSARAGWALPSARWLERARALAARHAALPRLLEGAEEVSPAERARFGAFCLEHARRHADALDLYREAFAEDPFLKGDLGEGHRYRAACAAARVAAGDGPDAPAEDERRALRTQALEWLRADLAARKKDLPESLADWIDDEHLAPVREPAGLSRLPADEREAWQRLWDEVRRAAR